MAERLMSLGGTQIPVESEHRPIPNALAQEGQGAISGIGQVTGGQAAVAIGVAVAFWFGVGFVVSKGFQAGRRR